MQKPFFSIIIPTYNRANLIGATIESVVNQSFTDWELIIVDDGSTDNTREIVSGFKLPNIHYVWQTNQERSAARNHGIDNAEGKFICFLDSDDLWRSNHLEILFQTIKQQNEKPALYFTSMRWNFPDWMQDVIFKSPVNENPVEYVIANQIGTPTVCIHHAVLKETRFNISLSINEDVEFFARIVAKSELIQIPLVTVDVFVHPGNTKDQIKDYISPQIKAMKIIFQNPELKSKISSSFKISVFKSLHHQLINHYSNTGQYSEMNRQILRFLLRHPNEPGNKAKLVLLLYHLPGGGLIKSIVEAMKK